MKTITFHLKRAAAVLLLCVLGSAGAWAQSSVVSVGNGTTGSSYLPSCTFSAYSMSQQIYTSAEIGKAGLITSIAFYNYDTGSRRTYDIYLSHTTKQAFDSQTDWVKIAADNKVYSGTVWLAQSQWTVIDLDTPFQYDGSQNLLLTVDDNTGEDTGSNHSVGTFDGSGNQSLYYYKMFGTPSNLDPTQTIAEEGSVYSRKNRLQLCFETYPKPAKLTMLAIGNVSAQLQWTLRSGATATNLRYRKAGDANWTTLDNLTDRSKTIEGLTAATQYEAQVQAVFAGGNKSDWTESLTFTTSCCPREEQAEVVYALRSNYTDWFGFAVQIMDVTDAANPVEVAYLHAPSYETYKGSLSLCDEHKYQVNWIYDAEHGNVNHSFAFDLTYGNGDALYSMNYYEAPEQTATLTTFVMDNGDFDYRMPTQLTADETYQDATLGWTQADGAPQWLVTYSKDPDFNPDEPEEDHLILAEEYPFVLSELEENTTYYYAVRAVELGDVAEGSAPQLNSQRAAEKVKILRNGKIRVKVGDKWETKIIKKLSRSQIRKILKSCDSKSRPKVASCIRKWTSDKKMKMEIELLKPRGAEVRYVVKTKVAGDEGTEVPLSDLMPRVLKGNPEGIKKHQVSITSETTPGGFDNVIFIKAKKGSEVTFKMSQGKTGATHEPYAVGWISNKKLGISKAEEIVDKTKVPDETLKKLLDENQRYEVKQSTETKMTKKTVEANDDTEGIDKSPQKATDETGEDGLLFIRHNTDGGGYLRVQEVKVTAPENVKEWTAVELPEGQKKHTLDDVPTGKTLLMKSEPVYKDGTKGINSPVATVVTPGLEVAPLPGKFSVDTDKKVYFSKGNLYGWRWEDDWSLSSKQYTVKGNANMTESGYPADQVDLVAWSTPKNYWGTWYGYGENDESTVARYQGPLADWGQSEGVTLLMGSGWQTMSAAQWRYMLDERPNAAARKFTVTVNNVKGLLLLPDEWTAPEGITVSDGASYTDEQFAKLEEAGAVLLPAAGRMNDGLSVDGVGSSGYYWTSTPSDADNIGSENEAYAMTFSTGAPTVSINSRRMGGAVRLVYPIDESNPSGIQEQTAVPTLRTDNSWYDLSGRRLAAKPTQRGLYIHNGRKVVIR
ncbi:MAG: fibronectin type III domain-containing protein [Prevotella sp.]|nr:fibronectin type III domain-containing protein [Prevotella sp.]